MTGCFSICAPSGAATLDELREQFRRGEYVEVLKESSAGRIANPYLTSWHRLEAEALMAVGRPADAYRILQAALPRDPLNVRLRLLARRAALFAGQEEDAEQHLQELQRMIATGRLIARDSDGLIAVGEAALLLGAEPKVVLTNLFRRAQSETEPSREGFLATGRLALDKRDYQLASRTFQDGLKAYPEDPDLWAGLAGAFLDGDRGQLMAHAEKALSLNPRHAGARLLVAEHLIDAEQYEQAGIELARVLDVNRRDHRALALRAVLAHLRGDDVEAERERTRALSTWSRNPEVDHLIGRKLSQKYRFSEGSAAQRRALSLDPAYLPARIQLAQDLLRLGKEEEGWPLVLEVQKADGYDVTAFNLATLRDKLVRFEVLQSEHFRLRMSADEAPIYGRRALALLERARQKLSTKYGLELKEPVTVEVYPSAGDFAVRTFGMPDNPGYLGVCFGVVITMNSPASQSANWEAVLWHEYCHVVTLSLTRNRMPRWLSEGISVHEEKLENPAWTRRMSLDYRDRILEGRMQPISEMSAAFLKAKGGADLQFAYYQSSLVVDFLMERYGLEKMKAALAAMGEGAAVNDALSRHVADMPTLDRAFIDYAKAQAAALGGAYDLARNADPLLEQLPFGRKNFHAELRKAREWMEKKDWAKARALLTELTTKGPYLPDGENTHALLAEVCREQGDLAGERAAWLTVLSHEADSLPALARLLAMAQQAEEWENVARFSDALLAISPLAPTPWRGLLDAEEKRGRAAEAAAAGEVLLRLDPPDAPSVHYRVARQLVGRDPDKARRHVLAALEEAPRFRAAYDLLLKLPQAGSAGASP